MADDDKFVLHDRPDPPAGGVPPVPPEEATQVRKPDAAPVPAPAPAPGAPGGVGERVDQFIDQGRKVTAEEAAGLKIRKYTKEGLRQFVLDLIAELSRKTCEEHVREIADLKAKIAALEAGTMIVGLRKEVDDAKAAMRSDFNTEQEGLRAAQDAEKRRLREEQEAEQARKLNELTTALLKLRESNPKLEARLGDALNTLERLNVELAMYQELQRQLKSGQGRTKLELERIVAELRNRVLELESELEYFSLEEEPDAEAFAQKADALAERLLAAADAKSEVLGVAARQAGLDARGAEVKFLALRQQMHDNNASIATVAEMVKYLKDVKTARDVAKLGEECP